MTDNGRKQRPVRTLTVKNFSVIKEAKLEFGKITVLIGPQASGKSLLCKLAFFLGQLVPEIIEKSLTENVSFASLIHRVATVFRERFPRDSWSGQDPLIQFETDGFIVYANRLGSTDLPIFSFGEEFVEEYYNGMLGGPGISRVVMPSRIRKQMESQGAQFSGPPIVEESIYIPTGRSYYSTPNKAFAALTTKNLDWVTQRYAPEFDAEYKALRESYDTDLPVLSAFGKLATGILRGRVLEDEGRLVFVSTDDNHRLPFELLSSGTLELLPVVNTLSQLAKGARFPDIPTAPVPPFGTVYVEEPELSVFPGTQNDLVRLFSWLAGEGSLWMSYAITTHSPYILTAFNNLIEASQVVAAKPELKDEIAKLIPEQYWIKPEDFRAYAIEDGVLKSIVAEDTGLVSANYLDQVSETIGMEFDELLRLGYVES